MSLDLTVQDVDEIYAEAERHCPPAVSIDHVETICAEPPQLGSGYNREIELCAGLELRIMDVLPCEMTLTYPESEHPIQFSAFLSGSFDCGDYLQVNPHQGYIGGSGIQPRNSARISSVHRQVGVDIQMTPTLFQKFFAGDQGELSASLQLLLQEDNWQHRFSPRMTGAIRTVVQQMIDCPFLGIAKRAYLQGKVFELIALQFDSLLKQDVGVGTTSLKAETVARIHYAAEILRSHYENPPSQNDLAQRVGISYRTLHNGFREIFQMTPFAYLTRFRMEQAEKLLRQPGHTVTEVANRVGYANPGKFAIAFKRQFGITPKECIRGSISH